MELINLTFSIEDKLKVCPYQLKEQIKIATSEPPKRITTSGRDTLTIQAKNEKQSNYILNLKQVQKYSCNLSRSIIFIFDLFLF